MILDQDWHTFYVTNENKLAAVKSEVARVADSAVRGETAEVLFALCVPCLSWYAHGLVDAHWFLYCLCLDMITTTQQMDNLIAGITIFDLANES